MSNVFPKEAWRGLYQAALFEPDKTKTAGRISDAEQAIVARVRNLFHHPDNHSAERNALEAALYALSILKLYTCARQNESNDAVIPGLSAMPNRDDTNEDLLPAAMAGDGLSRLTRSWSRCWNYPK